MRFLPHLVEVNEKYRKLGIEIIMATDRDSAPALEAFIAEKKLTLGIVRVPDVYGLVKARGYPTSYGIDVDGRVIWRGHPQGINDALVEGWLTGMRAPKVPRELARELGGAVSSYNRGKFGKALEDAQDELKKAKPDEETLTADGQYLVDLLQGRVEMLKAAAKQHETTGYLDRQFEVLEQSADEFAGTDFGDDCKKDARRLKRDRAYRRCIAARDDLAKLRDRLPRLKPEDAREALEDFIKEHRRTPYAAEAEARLAELADDEEDDDDSGE